MMVARDQEEGGTEKYLMSREFQFWKMKSSRDWMHNNVNIFTTELYI